MRRRDCCYSCCVFETLSRHRFDKLISWVRLDHSKYLRSEWLNGCGVIRKQCDQMTGLFIQYLAIYNNNNNWPIALGNNGQSRLKRQNIFFKKIAKVVTILAKSGHTVRNRPVKLESFNCWPFSIAVSSVDSLIP